MHRYYTRILIAIAMSLSGLLGTHYWYLKTKTSHSRKSKEPPIAYLLSQTNEVQRKPSRRVIWETITTNDPLYAGESIRTTPSSAAKIKFAKGDAVIELDPDSLVVLEKNDSGLALDFLKGSLFVAGKSAAGALQVKSGGKSIDLSKSSAALSTNSEGKLDFEIFEGQATLNQNGKQVALGKDSAGSFDSNGLRRENNLLKVLSPSAGDPVYLAPKEPLLVQWKKLAGDYTVHFEYGPNRNQLQRVESATAAISLGQLNVPIKIGKQFWRMVAVPKKVGAPTYKTRIRPLHVFAKVPAKPLLPEDQSFVISTELKVNFRWSNPAQFQTMTLQIASDAKMKTTIVQQPIEKSHTSISLPQEGQYYWRIIGYLKKKGQSNAVASSVLSFKVKRSAELLPPELISPDKKQFMTFLDVKKNGLFFDWKPVPGIQNYEFKLIPRSKKRKPIVKTISSPPLRLKSMRSGKYWWTVRSTKNNKRSKRAQPRQLIIDRIPKVHWLSDKKTEEHLYITEQPSFKIQWKPQLNKTQVASSWRVVWHQGDRPSQKTKVSQPYFEQNLSSSKKVKVRVEALDPQGQVIARSFRKTLTLKPHPLLPAPTFASSVPFEIKSDQRGRLSLSWKDVSGAKGYRLEILDPSGSLQREVDVERTTASLKGLKPGDFKVRLKSIDQYSRPGLPGEERSLKVPKTSNIRAPNLNKLKVK